MYFRRLYYKTKYFFINIYYTLRIIFSRLIDIYFWIYSVFFDDTESFEKKYSKYSSPRYKKRKQQRESSFYTNFSQDDYKNFQHRHQQTPHISNEAIKINNQFDSDIDYIVLGVPRASDFKTVIRPAYIKLINKYHADKLSQDDDTSKKAKYEEISKKINWAYASLKKQYKYR